MQYLKKPLDLTSHVRLRLMADKMPESMRLDGQRQVMCDFCGSLEPVVIYAASQLSTGQKTPCWRWTACRECEALLDSDRMPVIEDRLVKLLKSKMNQIPTDLLRQAARSSLFAFKAFALLRTSGQKPPE